jgi:hypothetical protein
MTTVGELMAELARFNPAARVSVGVDYVYAAAMVEGKEDGRFEVDVVEPIGCNPNDVQITLGVER